MKTLCAVFLFVILAAETNAQRQLVLVKNNKIITRFSEGDRIRFQRKKDDFFSDGIITGIHQTYIKLGEGDTTFLHELHKIDMHGLPNSGFKTADIGGKLLMAGGFLILIDVLNSSPSGQVDYGLIAVEAGLVISGTIMLFVNNNYFKIGRKKKAIVMEYKPPSH